MEQTFRFFDLISPFSYLHHRGLRVLRDRLDIRPVPVLFAGKMKHWGTKGPAEVTFLSLGKQARRRRAIQFWRGLARMDDVAAEERSTKKI